MSEKLEKLVQEGTEFIQSDTGSSEDAGTIADRILNEIQHPYDDKLMHYLDDVNPGKIVFIQGLHRSGTTFFYKLLKKSGFNSLDLYQIVSYDQLIYNHINGREDLARRALDIVFQIRDAETREYDHVEINSHTVEEYCHLTAREPNFFERKMPWLYALDYEGIHRTNRRNVGKLKEITKKMRFISENYSPIALKNPFDFTRFKFLHKQFPQAKFVFLHRKPTQAISSLYKALAKDYEGDAPVSYLYEINDFYRRTFENGVVKGFITKFSEEGWSVPILIKRASDQIREFYSNLGSIPQEAYINTNYEEIITEPNSVVNSVAELVGSDLDIPDLTQYVNTRESPLPPPVKKRERHINKSFPDNHYNIAGKK